MTTPKIQLTNVHKRFGDNVVLNGVNLEIMPGESVVIIGGSGTGKSVSIKCILGLLTPDAGDVKVDGRSVLTLSNSERNAVNAKIGMLFQHAALFDSLLRNDWRRMSVHVRQWLLCARQPHLHGRGPLRGRLV